MAMKPTTKPVTTRKHPAAKPAGHKPVASLRTTRSPTAGGRLVKIRDLGPIAEADIRLRPLTVFSGENGTGKSFACKAIYSFFSAMGEDQIGGAFRPLISEIKLALDRATRRQRMDMSPDSVEIRHKLTPYLEAVEKAVEILDKELSDLPSGNFQAQIDFFEFPPHLMDMCEEIHSACQRAASTMHKIPPANDKKSKIENIEQRKLIDYMLDRISALLDIPQKKKEEVIADGMKENLLDCLTHNFQANFSPRRTARITSLVDLVDLRALEIEEGGSLERNTKDTFHFTLPQNENWHWTNFSRMIFLDSPVYWKLKDVLGRRRFLRSSRIRRLDGIPQYFYDLVALSHEKFSPSTIHDTSKHLEEIIGGKIILTRFEELRFLSKSSGRKRGHSMLNTAAGIVNLGILSLLIERGIITENTILFIDEPESNLHQAWQEEMVEVLAQLVNAGVYVVVATHSDWMLSTIGNIVRRGELGESTGLNKEQVGVWLFEHAKNGGGSTTQEMEYDRIGGYIPGRLRKLSNRMHNETADLLDEMDAVLGEAE